MNPKKPAANCPVRLSQLRIFPLGSSDSSDCLQRKPTIFTQILILHCFWMKLSDISKGATKKNDENGRILSSGHLRGTLPRFTSLGAASLHDFHEVLGGLMSCEQPKQKPPPKVPNQTTNFDKQTQTLPN